MPEEIGAGDAEFLLREIPRQLREWRWEHQRRDATLGVVGLQSAALDAMGDEVVGITPTPRGLRPRPASDLTGQRRTRTLATADAPVRHKPATADAAGTLREHPQMLASSAGTQGGPLLASNPGSILASAEAVIVTGAFCVAGSLWFTLDLPKVRAIMRPIYQGMGLLPARDAERIPDVPEPATWPL